MGFLVRMLRVYALLLEPFVPTIAARLNYLLGLHPVPTVNYPQLNDLPLFILTCLDQSHGLKEPIPLVAESTSRLFSLLGTAGSIEGQIWNALLMMIIIIIMRKSSERRGSRISRTFLPAATPSEPLPISPNTPVSYFYKVQGNVKLLETADYG